MATTDEIRIKVVVDEQQTQAAEQLIAELLIRGKKLAEAFIAFLETLEKVPAVFDSKKLSDQNQPIAEDGHREPGR